MDKDFDQWYQYLGLISMVIYFILSLQYYTIYKKIIFQVVSYADSILFKWIKTYLIAFLTMLLLPIIFNCFAYFFPNLNSYKGNWWFFLFFSLIMYYIAITGYSNPVNSSIRFKFSELNKHQILLLFEDNKIIEQESVIDIDYEFSNENNSTEINLWKSKIENLMQQNLLFKNPELTLSDVAKELNTNVSMISKTINQGFKMNFNDFVNNYRIEEVKKAFEKGDHKKSTLLGIAFDCGFNSKATFNRAFKKNTGFSPKDYLKEV
ncbi:MAG: helix-turn-helix transcriptional regulator [Chryseobacterium sp.]|nr:helix-turn-helix transcriptional regulator [Chryseobacterium sp.]